MTGTKPSFLLDKPTPQIKQRLYNGRKIMVWEGKVKVPSIQGWVENPRIELAKKTFLEKVGDRPLTQEEIFDLMKNDPEVRLRELRDDIMKNGLREPLTLSFKGKLLDGNRRFFALKYVLESIPPTDPNKSDFVEIDAFVLNEGASDEEEQNVLVEENFSASLKIEWPDYVKAMMVVRAEDDGLTPDQIAKKFNWTKTKVNETLRIYEIIQEFETLAVSKPDPEDESGGGFGLTEQDAQVLAAKNYQYFNEAQKSFREPLKTDIDFKIQFFKWIKEKKFSNFNEVRVAHKAWKDPEAKAAIMGHDPSAAKRAKTILDYNERMVRSVDDAAGRIQTFTRFLKDMTAEEIKVIPEKTRINLQEILTTVIKMSQAASAE
jgi:hypothetical protein